MNKKGQLFVLMVTIFTAIALLYLFVSFSHKHDMIDKGSGVNANGDPFDSHLKSSAAILKTFQKQEETLLYLDLAAKKSLKESLIELGERGGLYKEECGQSIYYLWNTWHKDCFPNVNESLRQLFKNNFEKKIKVSPTLPLDFDHDIGIFYNDKIIELTGKHPNTISMAVSNTNNFIRSNSVPALSNSARAKINIFDDEITKATQDHEGISPYIIKGLIMTESSGKINIINSIGCAGLGQFCDSTAVQYFGKNNIIQDLESNSKCNKINGLIECPNDIYSNDDRFDKAIMIDKIGKYLNWLKNYYEDKQFSDAMSLAIAAYNAGPGTVDDAIKKVQNSLNKEDVNFAEIASELPDQTQTYVPRVNEYSMQFGGTDLSIGWTNQGLSSNMLHGTFEFNQNFKVSEKYNFSVYDLLTDWINQTIQLCENNVKICLEIRIRDFNNKYPQFEIQTLKECESGPYKVMYDFAEKISNCGLASDVNCSCKLTTDYTMNEIDNILQMFKYDTEYQIEFTQFAFGGGEYSSVNYTNTPKFSSVKDFNVPDKPISWLNDYANHFKADEKVEIVRLISALEEQTGMEVAIIVINQTKNYETKALEFFDKWGVGNVDDAGILFLLSPEQEAISMMIGRGIDNIFKATVSEDIVNTYITPKITDKLNEGLIEALDKIFNITQNDPNFLIGKFDKNNKPLFDVKQNMELQEEFANNETKFIKNEFYHINNTPYRFSFEYDNNYEFSNGEMSFYKDIRKSVDFDEIYLVKKNNTFEFVFNVTTAFLSINNGLKDYKGKDYKKDFPDNACTLYQDVSRLCLDTKQDLPYMENQEIHDLDSKIKFAITLKDTTPPIIKNLKTEWSEEYEMVMLSWEMTQDEHHTLNKFEVYYDNEKITDATQDKLIYTYYKESDIKPRGMNQGTPAINDVELAKNWLWYESGPIYKYHSLINLSFINQSQLNHYFAVIGEDDHRNKEISNPENFFISLPNIKLRNYTQEYIGLRHIWKTMQTCAPNPSCITSSGSLVTSAFELILSYPQFVFNGLAPRGNASVICDYSLLTTVLNPMDLEIGDVFSSDKPSSSFPGAEQGTAGIYIGKGNPKNPVNGCYQSYTQNISGEQLAITSTIKGVCYETLEDIKNDVGINKYCRDRSTKPKLNP